MVGHKSIERRPCAICRRVTPHTVTKSKNSMGKTLAEVAECREHRVWADGGHRRSRSRNRGVAHREAARREERVGLGVGPPEPFEPVTATKPRRGIAAARSAGQHRFMRTDRPMVDLGERRLLRRAKELREVERKTSDMEDASFIEDELESLAMSHDRPDLRLIPGGMART